MTNIYSKHMQTSANHHKPTCLSDTITIKSKVQAQFLDL